MKKAKTEPPNASRFQLPSTSSRRSCEARRTNATARRASSSLNKQLFLQPLKHETPKLCECAGLNLFSAKYRRSATKTYYFILLTSAFLIFSVPLCAQNLEEAKNLNAKGNSLIEQGKYQEALPLFEHSLAILKKIFGPEHINTAIGLNNLARVYRCIGDNAKALPLVERSLAIREKSLGPEHHDTATALNNLADVYRAMGDYAKSLTLFERSLAIWQKSLGPNHPYTATSLDNLAEIYSLMGNYSKALPFSEQSLAIREKSLGPEHPDVAASLGSLASIHHSLGNYSKSLLLFQRSSTMFEKSLGPGHPDTAGALGNLAHVYRSMGDHDKALTLYEKSLAILKKSLGADHPDTANALSSLAEVYSGMGNYSKALPLSEESLVARKKSLGQEHPVTANGLSSLAEIYYSMGDYAKALPLYEQSLAILEKSLGPEHPDTATGLNNAARAYYSIGNYAKALPLFEQSLAIREKSLGPEHPDTAGSLGNLAFAYESLGNYQKALPLFEQSLAITEKCLGPQHTNTAGSLGNLALAYESLGNYQKALPLFEHSFDIREKSLGPEHPDTIDSINNLAGVTYRMGDLHSARNYAVRLLAAKQDEFKRILNLDERSRLAWQKKNINYWLSCIFEPAMVAQMALNWKGVILDSLLEDQAVALASGKMSEGAQNLQKIAELRTRLSKIVFEQGKEKEKSDLESEISGLQRKLAQNYLGREMKRPSLNLTMRDITPALAGGVILLDFIHYRDPKIKEQDSQCLGIIITGEDNKPTLVRIDKATDIHRAIDGLRQSIKRGDAEAVQQFTSTLSKKLWAPIAAKIPQQGNRLIISPDGELNFLSFAALLDAQGKFLAETYDISYVGSARDLVRETKSKPSRTIRLFANPAFQRDPVKVDDMQYAVRSAEIDIFGQLQLPSLPGTEKESAEIQKIGTDAGWNLQAFTQNQADEQTLRKTKKPGILHLATHGFYLNSFTPAPLDSRGMSVIGIDKPKPNSKGVDPMRASGIALAGAQSTLKSWSERKAPAPETDGVLTAEEVAALDLDETWLVTLSACETGVGEARSGEGVFGLRRSFMLAGAENLLMTLWPVRDESTSEIMADFYREALKTGNAPSSLAKVQREWLVKLRKEKGFLEAVRDAGPFVMATIGKPLPPLPRKPEESQASLKQLK